MHTEPEIIEPKRFYEKNAGRFMRLKNTYEFYSLLMIDPFLLIHALNEPEYIDFQISKKSGGVRHIQAPEKRLKSIQRSLNYYLQAVYLRIKPTCVHGFVMKQGIGGLTFNITSNAQVHVKSKYLLNLDIKDFFPSISAHRIKQTLTNKPFVFNDEISTLIALLGSYNKKLPTGSPCSPVLANMACYEMDQSLQQFCDANQINYSRYADDLSFSGSRYFTNELIDQIRKIIIKHQFILNQKKIRLQSSKSRQTVTGIVVNQKVNVNRKYILELRAILYHWKTEGLRKAAAKHYKLTDADEIAQATFIQKIKGQIGFVGQVRGTNDLLYKRMMEKYWIYFYFSQNS